MCLREAGGPSAGGRFSSLNGRRPSAQTKDPKDLEELGMDVSESDNDGGR